MILSSFGFSGSLAIIKYWIVYIGHNLYEHDFKILDLPLGDKKKKKFIVASTISDSER